MNMKSFIKGFTTPCLLLMLFVGASITYAQTQSPNSGDAQTEPRGKFGRGMGMFDFESLDLTDAQKEQIKTIRERYVGKSDGAESGSTAGQRPNLSREDFMKMNEEIMNVLTPEQRTKLKEERMKKRDRNKGTVENSTTPTK